MKRITALITVITIIFTMAVPAWASDSYISVSVDKPITSLHSYSSSYPPEYANDDAELYPRSEYRGNKGPQDNDFYNALTIDLERKFVVDHITVTASNVSASSVYLSNDSDFATYTELEFDRTEGNVSYYKLPSAYAGSAYQYVRYSFLPSASYARIRNFQAYVTEENAGGAGAQLIIPPIFEEEIIKISEGKPILSMQYGESGFLTNVAANAVDSDPNTEFISCQYRDKPEWVTIDLEEAEVINKIESNFTAQRTYGVYVTNTVYGQTDEFADGIQLNETSPGSKIFVLPDEFKNTAYRYVRLRFDDDAPNTGNDTEQNIYIKDISVYKSSRDVVYNAASQKSGGLTDGNTEVAVSVANNTVIDLLAPTYISSYEIFGSDKDNVTIKGSLFNTTVDNMTEIPQKSTDNKQYRYIAIVSDSTEEISLNEIQIWSFFTDVVTPWILNENICSVEVTNTSHKDDRSYTLTTTAFDEYGVVMGVKSVTETLAYGESKIVELEVDGADYAKKVVCTITRDSMLVSAPAIFIDGVKVATPSGTPYTTPPVKDIESAVVKTDYFDGLELEIQSSDTAGIVDSDILSLSIYDSSDKLLSSDAVLANGTFKYRLSGTAAAGDYKAVLMVTDALGNTVLNKYTFTKTASGEAELSAAINAFAQVATDEEFQAAYQTYYVENGTMSFSDIPEVEALLTDGIGNSFIKMMSSRTLWKKSAGTTLTVEDIRDCAKAAVVENALENSRSNAPTILQKYADVLDNVFDGKQNNKYTAEIFRAGATNNETLIYNMKIAAALSQMKNASSETVASVLQNYSDILKVDLAAISSSGVDLLLVAKRLDKTIPESYKDGLSAEITKILEDNKIPEEENNNNNDNQVIIPSGGGGGGGGYAVGDNAPKEEKEEPKEEVKTDDKTTENISFSDVADGFWAEESITKLAKAGIVSGRGNGSYDPDSQVSRAEFATMLVRAFKLISDPEDIPEFSDCKVSDWFYPFVDAAVSNNIVNGISETEFAPLASIRRQDACVMSYNMMICKNYLKYFEGRTFTDSDMVPTYAKDAVNMLSGSGVINGFEDNTFRPQELVSRAQAAVIVYNLMLLLGEEV